MNGSTLPSISDQVMMDRIADYLHSVGSTIDEEDRRELLARIEGHTTAAEKARFDEAAKIFRVYAAALDDYTVAGVFDPIKTFEQVCTMETTNPIEAQYFAEKEAERKRWPFVVYDGNKQLRFQIDGSKGEQTYEVVFLTGEIYNDNAEYATVMDAAEDLVSVDAGIVTLPLAMEAGLRAMVHYSRVVPPGIQQVLHVWIVEQESKRVIHRLRSEAQGFAVDTLQNNALQSNFS